MTYTRLYYIFNFGSLSAENEREYIIGIEETEINDYVNNKNFLNEIKQKMKDKFTMHNLWLKKKMAKNLLVWEKQKKSCLNMVYINF